LKIRQENVIFLRIWEPTDFVDAYTGRFVDGDFEVNRTFETLQLDFHQALQELAMQSLPVVQEEHHHRWNMLQLQLTYCDAFRRGSTDLRIDYHTNVGSKKSVRVTFDKQADQKVNELQDSLTEFIDTIIESLAVKPQDVTLLIDGGSSFCLPDRRLFRDFFPQQVVELSRPSGTRGINAFDTQRTQWFLGEERVQVESYDSSSLGLALCKVREELALREEVEALRREKMEEVDSNLGKFRDLAERREDSERKIHTMETSLIQVLNDDFPLAHPRFNSCWSLQKPTVEDCRHDAKSFLDLHNVKAVLAIQWFYWRQTIL